MIALKENTSDFEVKEIPLTGFAELLGETGEYAYCLLKKEDYTTLKAIQLLSRHLRIPQRCFGFAGVKDRKAITEQYISVRSAKPLSARLEGITLTPLGRGKRPLSLGLLSGNRFTITVRSIEVEEVKTFLGNMGKGEIARAIFGEDSVEGIAAMISDRVVGDKHLTLPCIPNLFDAQRFSKNNAEIGKLLVKKDFAKAAALILRSEGEHEQPVREHLRRYPADAIGAMRKLPKSLLKLYLHAYQSRLFNEIARRLLRQEVTSNLEVPLFGFATEPEAIGDPVLRDMANATLKREGITPRDYIFRELPELSATGAERRLFMDVSDFLIKGCAADDMHEGRVRLALSFSLGRGSYATMAVRQLFTMDLLQSCGV